jgi:hypothetical protein
MQKIVSPLEVTGMFVTYLRQRPDIGFRKAITNLLLRPANPFNPEARRPPNPVVLIAAAALAATAGCFIYFNLLP